MAESEMPPKPSHPPSLLSRLYPNLRLAPLTPLRIAGFFPVVVVLAIIALAYITAVPATLVPLLPFHPLLIPPLLILFHLLFLSTLINYILLLLIDPGSPPPSWSSPPPPHPFPYAHLMHQRTHHGQLRYCFSCSAFKPDRSHHCSICNRCILRMDHHCVFINNCVSFHNHKFFVSFITTAFLGSLFVTLVSLPTFSAILSTTTPTYVHHTAPTQVLTTLSHLWQSAPQSIQNMSPALRTLAMIGYITTTAFAFALAIFVILHFYLLSKGRTTIEMYELADSFRRHDVLAYDLGMRKNFASICGTVPLCWLVPTRAYVEGDGLDWERADLSEEHGPLNV